MKKLALIVLLAVGLSAQAQEKKDNTLATGEKSGVKKEQREQMTPEQKNQLRLKKLTLDLNLTPAQQKQIGALLSEQSEKREKMKAERKASKEKAVELTAEERFERKNKMLDEEKALKDKVQKILDADQFKKWEEMKKGNREEMKDRMEKRTEKKTDKE